mmetsp:Transcript_25845/g.83700  ORF Transcript_25845/g.83700 Transcript_25845/m.83700 type:complete len:299 (-) Transcript_25845:8-904(-)
MKSRGPSRRWRPCRVSGAAFLKRLRRRGGGRARIRRRQSRSRGRSCSRPGRMCVATERRGRLDPRVSPRTRVTLPRDLRRWRPQRRLPCTRQGRPRGRRRRRLSFGVSHPSTWPRRSRSRPLNLWLRGRACSTKLSSRGIPVIARKARRGQGRLRGSRGSDSLSASTGERPSSPCPYRRTTASMAPKSHRSTPRSCSSDSSPSLHESASSNRESSPGSRRPSPGSPCTAPRPPPAPAAAAAARSSPPTSPPARRSVVPPPLLAKHTKVQQGASSSSHRSSSCCCLSCGPNLFFLQVEL